MPNIPIYTTHATDAVGTMTDGVAVSSTTTYYSALISGNQSDGMGIHLQWTGTPTGTFTLWMSDKAKPSLADDADWVEDTSFSPSNPAGSPSKMRDDTANAK